MDIRDVSDLCLIMVMIAQNIIALATKHFKHLLPGHTDFYSGHIPRSRNEYGAKLDFLKLLYPAIPRIRNENGTSFSILSRFSRDSKDPFLKVG